MEKIEYKLLKPELDYFETNLVVTFFKYVIVAYILFYVCIPLMLANINVISVFVLVPLIVIIPILLLMPRTIDFYRMNKKDVEAEIKTDGIYFIYGKKNTDGNKFKKITSKKFVSFRKIRNVDIKQDVIYIYKGFSTYIIPKRVFPTTEEFYQFHKYILYSLDLNVQRKVKSLIFLNNQILKKIHCCITKEDVRKGGNFINSIPEIKKANTISLNCLIISGIVVVVFSALGRFSVSDYHYIFFIFSFLGLFCIFYSIYLIFNKCVDDTFKIGYSTFDLEVQSCGMSFVYTPDEMSQKNFMRKVSYVNCSGYVKWSEIKSLYKTPESIFVSSKSGWHCIPKSAFGSDTEYEEFYNLISSYARK